MPCLDGRDDMPSYKEYQERIDKYARMLCAVMQKMPTHIPLPKEVNDWWEQHQAEDRRRAKIKAEQRNREKQARRKQYLALKKEFE